MEYEKIKQLMEDVGNSKLSAIDIDFPDGTKIRMKKEEEKIIISGEVENLKVENANLLQKENINTQTNQEQNTKMEGKIVKAPMVGTFYLKPAPTSAPYVEIGKEVKKGDTLCIIESMKLMNEIESEYDGKIVEILVKDGEAVEYGKPLFRIS